MRTSRARIHGPFTLFFVDMNWIQFSTFHLTHHVGSCIESKSAFFFSIIAHGGISAMAFKVAVDGEECKGCEDCLEACTANVFEMKESKSVPLNAKECLGCGSCVEVCKEKAITVEELKSDLSEVARSLLGDIL